MTHDELLAMIDRYAKNVSILDAHAWSALRAVVELHKQANENGYCEICPDFDYPCLTIQTIEKEWE